MDSYDDAARILKGMLNIGGHSDAGNGQGSSSLHENNEGSDRLNNGLEFAPENITESIDSSSEHESETFRLDPVLQSVHFTGVEQQGSVSIYGNEVNVTTDEVDTEQLVAAGSNRVRIVPVVNFDWEPKYYNGNLLSVSSKYMAYAIRGKSGFCVRILDRKTVQKALIKGFTGSIEDISFAHYDSDHLACIDSAGDIFIWQISEDNDKINYTLKLQIKRKNEKLPEISAGNRLVWCPFVVDEDDDENVSEQVLAVCVGRVAEVFDIDMITADHHDTVDVENIEKGIVRIQHGHTNFITDIALAPDGSVLATASEDGGVKFWQLDFQSRDPPLCLHEWQPHEGQPVSRLMFCDNHVVQDDKSPFWRFLITGAKHNSELKIWCTVTWSCIQTIRFKLPATNLTFASPPSLKLKASLDLSANYLVLSDIHRKVLYVFLLYQNVEEGKAHLTSVAHFILTQPLLSFVISEAKSFKALVRDSMDQNGDREGLEQDEGQEDGEEAKRIPTIRVKLHCINPKAMQEMTVQYYPYASVRPVTPVSVAASSLTNTETGVQDGLSDVSLDTSMTEQEDVEPRPDSSAPKLIAPNAFATTIPKPVKPASQTDHDIEVTQPEPASVGSSITSVTSMNNSLASVNIDQFLGKSQISESDCSFKTCDDVTVQEHPSGFNSWLGHTSPLGLPLPESPNPAKVPFPAFANDRRGVNQPSEDDNISGVTHSTPLRRRSADQDEDTDKTPTGEEKILPEEQNVLSSSPPRVSLTEDEDLNPSGKDLSSPDKGRGSEKFFFDGSRYRLEFTSSDRSVVERAREEDTLTSYHTPVTGQLDQDKEETEEKSTQKLPHRSQRNTKLTVTPRRHIDIQPEAVAREQPPTANDNTAIDDIRNDIRQLREMVENQQREQNVKVSEVLREEVAILEGAISSRLETILGQHNMEQDQMFEKFTRDKQVNEKQRYEKMATSITTAVLNKVEKTVKNEIRNSVSSGFQKVVNPLQDQLNTVMTQKLTVAEDVMKESIAKMVKDKSIVDAIGKSVSEAIQVSFQTTMNDFFTRSMLPGFEKACRAMYTQINTAFENGTKQYIQNFESYADNRKDIEKQQKDTIVGQLQALVQNFQAASEKLSTTMSGNLLEMMQTQLTTSMKRLQSSLLTQLQEDLNKSLQETIQKEVSNVLMEQSAFGNDAASQQRSFQLRIEQLINEKDFAGAFQEALTAADLNLVMMVCQSCDPLELFGQDPCPLNQPILLSLIQQLSVDLSSDTELKNRYLQEAIVALDTEDPVTREHVTSILQGLCEQIKETIRQFAQDEANKPLQRPLKRLHMAAQSLISH